MYTIMVFIFARPHIIYLTFLFILLVYFEKQLYLGFTSTKKHILFSISGKFQSKETLPKLC